MFPDNFSLTSATLSVFSVVLASVLVFEPSIRASVNPGTAVLAPTWALILTSYHAGTVFAAGVRSIIGACIGAGLGAAAYSLASLLPSSIENQHILGTVIVIPFAFFLMLADNVVASPLSSFIQADVALLSMYLVATFSNGSGYVSCINAIIALSYGSLSAITIVSLFRLFSDIGSTHRQLRDAKKHFQASQTNWLEGLTAFMTSASDDHVDELKFRQEVATGGLATFQKILSTARQADPLCVLECPAACSEITVTIVLMHSQLLAFNETISQESYSDDTMRAAFPPSVYESFNRTRMAVVLALRPTSSEKIRKFAHSSLKNEAINLYDSLISNAALTAQNRHSDLPIGRQVVRLHSAVFSLIIFTLLVDHYIGEVETATRIQTSWTSFLNFYSEKFFRIWKKDQWKKTTNFAYMYRAVIGQQIVAQIALFISRSDEKEFGPYVLWSMLPILFTFLSTMGGTVIKGSKRILGTLIGGGLGCITALTNSNSPSSFFLEMMIVAFIANLFSYHPACGYASTVGGITWIIITLPSIAVTDTSVMLHRVLYRLVLTVGGVVASLLISCLMFPSFSSSEMRTSVSKSIGICTQLISDGIRGVVEGTPFQEDGINRLSATSSVSSFRGAGEKALRSLQKYIAKLHVLCVESRAEMAFVQTFCCASDNTVSVRTLTDAERNLYRLIDSVLVLVATSATTRTSRHAHELFFTEAVLSSLIQFVAKVELSGTKLAGIIHGDESYSLDDCYISEQLECVDQNLMAVRQILGETRRLPEAVVGGSPLIYVFLFALGEMTDNWDEFVRGLSGTLQNGKSDQDRFRRVSSSISNMNIF